MSQERTYYVICEDNCKFESMTKEQILAAIAQATGETEGSIDVDEAFITKVKEMNANAELKFWVGTQAQYNALTTVSDSTLYLITDQTQEDLEAELADIEERIKDFNSTVNTLNGDVDTLRGDVGNLQIRVGSMEDFAFARTSNYMPAVTGEGSNTFMKIAKIEIVDSYADGPISFVIGRRGDKTTTTLTVKAYSLETVEVYCQYFQMEGQTNPTDWWLTNGGNGVFELFCTGNTWGENGICDVMMSPYMSHKCNVTLLNERVSAFPEGDGIHPTRKAYTNDFVQHEIATRDFGTCYVHAVKRNGFASIRIHVDNFNQTELEDAKWVCNLNSEFIPYDDPNTQWAMNPMGVWGTTGFFTVGEEDGHAVLEMYNTEEDYGGGTFVNAYFTYATQNY